MRTTRSFKVWSLIAALAVACSGAGCSESDDSTGDDKRGDDGADDAGPPDPSNTDGETSDDTGSADDVSDKSPTGTVSEGTADDGETDDSDNPASDDGSDDSSATENPGNSETGTDSTADDSDGSETDGSDSDDSETDSSGSDPSDTDASSDESGSDDSGTDGSATDETSDDGGPTDDTNGTDPPSGGDPVVDAPTTNTGEGALGADPYPGLSIEQSSFYQDAEGAWIWLAIARNDSDTLPCRISISATATFDSEQEIEFFGSIYGENHAPDYDKDGSPDPETAGSFFSCLPKGQSGVMVAYALAGLPPTTNASNIVDIQYGVSAEDWTDATAVESEQLTLQDVRSQNGKISGSAKNGAIALTGVTAMVLPLSEDGVPLRFYELTGGELAADATWEFETPAIDIEFAESRVLFSYVGE